MKRRTASSVRQKAWIQNVSGNIQSMLSSGLVFASSEGILILNQASIWLSFLIFILVHTDTFFSLYSVLPALPLIFQQE